MKVSCNAGPDGTVVSISGDLDIYHSSELKDVLLEAFERSRNLEIRFGDVERVDFSFLQILYSAHKTAEGMGGELVIAGDRFPDPVSDLCRKTGFHWAGFFSRYCPSGI